MSRIESRDLLRAAGRAAYIHAGHGALLEQDGGAAGDRIEIGDMPDTYAYDVGESLHGKNGSTMRLITTLFVLAAALPAADYWPGQRWRTSLPEAQGIDSQALTAAVNQVLEQKLSVHSLLVIRHGYAVLDASFYPYNAGTPHDLA